LIGHLNLSSVMSCSAFKDTGLKNNNWRSKKSPVMMMLIARRRRWRNMRRRRILLRITIESTI